MAINITRIFTHEGQEYLADITVRTDKDYRSECAIFKSEGGQFTFDTAIPLYLKMDVGLDYGALNECIAEFIEQLNSQSD